MDTATLERLDLPPAPGAAHHDRPQPRIARREFLRAGAGGTALLGLFGLAGRGAVGQVRAHATAGVANPLLTLVKRTSQGFSLEDYALAHGLGYDNFLEVQLRPESIPNDGVERRIAAAYGLDTLDLTPSQLYDALQVSKTIPSNQAYRDLAEATLLRAALSRRQLHERMVEFWTNHFNLNFYDGAVQYLNSAWDRDVIREHAIGSFPALLRATAKSPAMLYYLDNNTNRKGRPQENYARELLELHTLGADRGYTQRDVQELARCLTGWTLYGTRDANFGQFRFVDNRHDTDPKTVLGLSIPANQSGTTDGDQVIDLLAKHPNTAYYIAEKLAAWFLGENPAAWVVNNAAYVFLRTNGNIRAVLRVILGKNAIKTATPKIRQPRGFVTNLVRATQARVTTDPNRIYLLSNDVANLGQRVHRWETPDGFPDTMEAWGKSLLPRWRYASNLFDGRVKTVSVDTTRLLGRIGALTAGREAWGIDLLLTGGAMTDAERTGLQAFIDAEGPSPDVLNDAFALAASAPSAQLY